MNLDFKLLIFLSNLIKTKFITLKNVKKKISNLKLMIFSNKQLKIYEKFFELF